MHKVFVSSILAFCILAIGFLEYSKPVNAFFFFKTYLKIPYVDLAPSEQRIYDRHIAPWFEKGGHKIMNAGTADKPWYCVEFRWPGQAERYKELMSRPSWSASIAKKSFIEPNCAAG